MSREAVPNLNQRIGGGTDRDQGIPAVQMTPQSTAGMRKEQSIIVCIANGSYPTRCCPFRSVLVSDESAKERAFTDAFSELVKPDPEQMLPLV